MLILIYTDKKFQMDVSFIWMQFVQQSPTLSDSKVSFGCALGFSGGIEKLCDENTENGWS